MTTYIASIFCDGSMKISANVPDAKTCLVSARVTGSNISIVWVNYRATEQHKARLVKALRARMGA